MPRKPARRDRPLGIEPPRFDPDEVFVSPLTAEEEAQARSQAPTPPVWPVVVGGVSLVVGVVSIPLNLGLLALPRLLRMVDGLNLPVQIDLPPLSPSASAEANAIAKAGVAVLLAIAGALTLARRRIGAWLHLVYGAAGVATGAWGLWVNAQQQAAILNWARDHPDAAAAQFIGEPSAVAMIVSVVAALAWPVFSLVWFGAIIRRRQALGRP